MILSMSSEQIWYEHIYYSEDSKKWGSADGFSQVTVLCSIGQGILHPSLTVHTQSLHLDDCKKKMSTGKFKPVLSVVTPWWSQCRPCGSWRLYLFAILLLISMCSTQHHLRNIHWRKPQSRLTRQQNSACCWHLPTSKDQVSPHKAVFFCSMYSEVLSLRFKILVRTACILVAIHI